MKIPLRFQITEFDCGTVALQNAISYLFDRENVPAELVRAISIYTVNCYDEKGNKQVLRLREELAIVFQHEMDHLNGILFYDHIDPKNPYKNMDNMREI